MPKVQTLSTFFGIPMVLYLAGAFVIAKYLEKQHTEAWDKLGSPSFLNWGIANSVRLGWAILVGSSLVRLGDRRLSALVWTERVRFVPSIAGMIWVAHLRSGGHP